MAIICREHKLLFIMTPRTACTSIGSLLVDEFGGEYLPEQDLVENEVITLGKKHSTLKQLLQHQLLTKEQVASYCKFTTVRNPFDSVTSLYQKQSEDYQPLLKDPDSWVHRVPGYVERMTFCRDHSFDEWVKKYYRKRFNPRGAVGWILGRQRPRSMFNRFTDGMNFTIKFENLQNDFNTVLREARISKAVEIPKINRTANKKNYREYYTPTSRKIIEQASMQDLLRYEYEF